MRKAFLGTLAFGSLLAFSAPGLAQLVPDLDPLAQAVSDRQAERAQSQAVERALQKAEGAQSRVLEQTRAQQAGAVQDQISERVTSQVERAQSQLERVQNQAAERAQEQIGGAERVRERLPDVAQAPERGGAIGTRGLAAAADETAGGVPERGSRGTVNAADGNPVFVEITLEPGVRAVEFEWVMLVSPAQRQQLDAEAGDLLSFLAGAQPFTLIEGELLTFRVPPDLDADDAILQLVPENLRSLIDRNHIYGAQNEDEDVPATAALLPLQDEDVPATAALLPLPMAAVCADPLAIGMIDSAIDTQHAAFAGMARRQTRIHGKAFVEAPLVPSVAHGTAVAGLLVGDAATDDAVLRPLLPGATVFSAAVFHANEEAEQGATVQRVLAALNWLAAQDEVQVINMSLAGPPNRLLEQAITAVMTKGKVVVAAVGNEGAHGPLRYPAAYAAVIGATAVARDGGIFRWANQGGHIDYAALGVALPTARADGSIGLESGTSLAAPVVSAFFACALAHGGTLESAFTALNARAVDLGEPGTDPVFGQGLLHP